LAETARFYSCDAILMKCEMKVLDDCNLAAFSRAFSDFVKAKTVVVVVGVVVVVIIAIVQFIFRSRISLEGHKAPRTY